MIVAASCPSGASGGLHRRRPVCPSMCGPTPRCGDRVGWWPPMGPSRPDPRPATPKSRRQKTDTVDPGLPQHPALDHRQGSRSPQSCRHARLTAVVVRSPQSPLPAAHLAGRSHHRMRHSSLELVRADNGSINQCGPTPGWLPIASGPARRGSHAYRSASAITPVYFRCSWERRSTEPGTPERESNPVPPKVLVTHAPGAPVLGRSSDTGVSGRVVGRQSTNRFRRRERMAVRVARRRQRRVS
jgi:hypothetical protein